MTAARDRAERAAFSTVRVTQIQAHDDGLNEWRTVRIAPPPELAGDVFGYADYRERTGGFTARRELPHAEGVLIVNLGAPVEVVGGDGGVVRLQAGEAFVAGAHLRPAISRSRGAQAGVHVFLPLATLRRLLGTPMDRLIDRVAPLDALLGAAARDLGRRMCEAQDVVGRAALLDAALAARVAAAPPLGRGQAHALRLLRGRPDLDVAEIARDVGWSRKHLAARVQDAVGVGPRCFRRLLRFQRLNALIAREPGRPDWSGLALDAGYCDQSHMIREFREFSGLTPKACLARSLPDGGGLIEA